MREKLNISQRTLAEMLNLSHAYIAQIESENHYAKYSAYHIYLIAKYFECQVSDLYPPIDPLAP